MTRSVGWAGIRRPCRPGRGLVVGAVVTVTAALTAPAAAAAVVPGRGGVPGHAAAAAPYVYKTRHVGRRAGVPLPMTRDSRTVRHANGRYTTTIYPGPVNYHT